MQLSSAHLPQHTSVLQVFATDCRERKYRVDNRGNGHMEAEIRLPPIGPAAGRAELGTWFLQPELPVPKSARHECRGTGKFFKNAGTLTNKKTGKFCPIATQFFCLSPITIFFP